jgi:flagellar biosynthetic protein FliR
MNLSSPLFEVALLPALLAAVRMAGFVAVGTVPLTPDVPVMVRLGLAWSLSIAVVPWVLADSTSPPRSSPLLLALLSELALGGLFGLSVACVTAAAGWAGGVLGSISGLSWADDFSNGSAEAATPLARLLWWVSVGAFVWCGGPRVVLACLLDSLTALPLAALATASRLAVAVALPAMLAVLFWHATAAIACRLLPLSPSTGLLQGSAAIVLMLAIWAGGPIWTAAMAHAMASSCEHVLTLTEPATGVDSP